jgi:ABC-type branched-subunit amino acid transport system permease subunit
VGGDASVSLAPLSAFPPLVGISTRAGHAFGEGRFAGCVTPASLFTLCRLGVRPVDIRFVPIFCAELKGGRGNMVGAASGVILLGFVPDILDPANVSNYWIEAINGAVILFALFLARIVGDESTAEER